MFSKIAQTLPRKFKRSIISGIYHAPCEKHWQKIVLKSQTVSGVRPRFTKSEDYKTLSEKEDKKSLERSSTKYFKLFRMFVFGKESLTLLPQSFFYEGVMLGYCLCSVKERHFCKLSEKAARKMI